MMSDEQFIKELKASQDTVWLAAQFLSEKGHNVVVRAQHIRPTFDQRHQYADSGDLEIIQTVEVKRRPDLHFTSAEDYPFKTIIVDTVSAFDNKKNKPYLYMIVNAEATHAVIITVPNSRKHWIKVMHFNKKDEENRMYYECPKELGHYTCITVDKTTMRGFKEEQVQQ